MLWMDQRCAPQSARLERRRRTSRALRRPASPGPSCAGWPTSSPRPWPAPPACSCPRTSCACASPAPSATDPSDAGGTGLYRRQDAGLGLGGRRPVPGAPAPAAARAPLLVARRGGDPGGGPRHRAGPRDARRRRGRGHLLHPPGRRPAGPRRGVPLPRHGRLGGGHGRHPRASGPQGGGPRAAGSCAASGPPPPPEPPCAGPATCSPPWGRTAPAARDRRPWRPWRPWRRTRADPPGSVSASYEALVAAAAGVPPGAEGLFFLPHLMGERGPRPDPLARGALVGLTLLPRAGARRAGGAGRHRLPDPAPPRGAPLAPTSGRPRRPASDPGRRGLRGRCPQRRCGCASWPTSPPCPCASRRWSRRRRWARRSWAGSPPGRTPWRGGAAMVGPGASGTPPTRSPSPATAPSSSATATSTTSSPPGFSARAAVTVGRCRRGRSPGRPGGAGGSPARDAHRRRETSDDASSPLLRRTGHPGGDPP